LDGSVPALGLQQLKEYRSELDQRECPAGLTDAEWKYRKRKLAFTKYDELLDVAVHSLLELAFPRSSGIGY